MLVILCGLFEWKRISAGFIIVYLHLYCPWISSHQGGEGLDQINRGLVGLFYIMIWISISICRSLFMVSVL